jgi:hypothetical protein
MIERTCVVCGDPFVAKRSDALTCTDACRAKKSRRSRDPLIGSPERRQAQRTGQLRGLNKKYAGRQRWQARIGIQRMIAAHHLHKDGWPWLKNYWVRELAKRLDYEQPPLASAFAEQFRIVREKRRVSDPNLNLWLPSDSFDNHEVYIGFRNSERPEAGWHRGPFWPIERLTNVRVETKSPWTDIYDRIERLVLDPRSQLIVDKPVRTTARGKSWNRIARGLPRPPKTFSCKRCGGEVNVAQVLSHGTPPVIEVPTNNRATMSELCSRLYTAIVNKGVTHDGNERLAAHMANAMVKETPDGAYITKGDRHSSRKIDLAVAAVLAFGRAAVAGPQAFVLV